jgi:cytochrome oxidase Cu insertion factor (SCO1/SenC/PrrC family)
MKPKIFLPALIAFLIFYFSGFGSIHISKPKVINYKSIHLRVYYDRTKSDDTLTLVYYANLLSRDPQPGYDNAIQISAGRQKDGGFDFNFTPTAELGYIYVTKNFKKNDKNKLYGNKLIGQLIEAGDDVNFCIKFRQKNLGTPLVYPSNLDYVFSGINAKKYQVINKLDSIPIHLTNNSSRIFNSKQEYNSEAYFESEIRNQLDYLQKNRNLLGDKMVDLLSANVCYGSQRWAKYVCIKNYLRDSIPIKDTVAINSFREHYFLMSGKDEYPINEDVLYHSNYYAYSEVYKFAVDDFVAYGSIDYNRIFTRIIDTYKGVLRDKLITAFISQYGSRNDKFNDTMTKAFKIVTDPYCLEILNKLKSRMNGNLAFNFHLQNKDGDTVSLSNFKGKLVFVDFWYTGCGNCAGYFKTQVSKAEAYFKDDKNIVFITISIDKDRGEWTKSVESGVYTSGDAINLFTNGMGSRHPVIQHFGVISYPNPLLVGRDGKVITFGFDKLRDEKNQTLLIETLKRAEANTL